MLYMIEVSYRESDLAGQIEELREEHWRDLEEHYASGRLLGLWRKAGGGGVYVVDVVDVVDHEALREFLTADVIYPYYTAVEVTPLVPHPLFPQFAEASRNRTEG